MYPIKIISVEKMRALEEQANEGGLGFDAMMENAGRATAQAIQNRFGVQGRQILILVGPGNNGGDGLVAAHYLHEMGASVTCYLWKRRGKADDNLDRVVVDGTPVRAAEKDDGFADLRGLASKADIVVDALLGIGVSRPIEGELNGLLEAVRTEIHGPSDSQLLVGALPSGSLRARAYVVAVDCPSGLECNAGAVDPATLPADLTVTYAYPKSGLLKFPGAEVVGELAVADIAIPAELAEDVELELATPNLVRTWLPKRPRSAHKGTFGRAMIVAGSVNYVGAASLAGAGATRVGAGLITMALPMPIHPSVSASLTEATYLLLPHDMGVISEGAVKVLKDELGGYQSLLLGPGLTQEDTTIAFVHGLLGLAQQERRGQLGFVTRSESGEPQLPDLPPLVIDADGLNALAQSSEWWRSLPEGTIITPHPGEMSRLTGNELSVAEIQADRERVAQTFAAKWGVVLVLKGAFTVIAEPGGRCLVLPFANPGLATAGSGDVLAGAIVGLRAQGLAAFEAAASASYLHGLAGELARRDVGSMGTVASDLLPRLPRALQAVLDGR